ncbi:MAG: hypothetical protein U1E29_18205, partial [Coriobacteriia bacterium]|nr:hypothetical protein [Coriobacteriia bacterium]
MPAVEDYVASAAALRDALDRIAEQELDSYDELSAFRVWVAREFEGAGSELAAFPSPDDGISFYLSEPSALTVYLCDSRLEFGGGSEMPVWGSEVVDRFFRALDALIAGSQQPFADKALQRVAQGVAKDLAREPDSVSLNGTLALMGELTLDARQRFEVLRRERPGMTVDVVSWVGIRERLDAQGLPPSKSFHVDLHIDSMVTDALKQRDWLVGLVYARDFVAAMERFGVQLFDLNVRNELRKSRVNKEIVKTVGRQLGRRNFHHLNNGILVACNS